MNKIDSVKETLEKYGQMHLLRFYDELNDEEKTDLIEQINSIDFAELKTAYNNETTNCAISNIEPLEDIYIKSDFSKSDVEEYSSISQEAIKQNKIAVLIMAGGQGTRLGFDGPKGTYKLKLSESVTKSIFQICVEDLLKAHDKYDIYPYCFIMTSDINHDDTIKFFEDNNYFTYDKNRIVFFKQGNMPLTDLEGNIALKDKSNIYFAPNGNGGIFKALHDEKVLATMEEKGIEYLFIANVDNILLNPFDDIVFGHIYSNKADLGIKTIIKENPEEKMGLCVNADDKFKIIEYIDMPKDKNDERCEDGTLKYKEGYFGVSYVSRDLLTRINTLKLPYHNAKKQNKYIDTNGNESKKDINSIKYEMFIFDGFGLSNKTILYRVNREDEFAPIKDKDSVENAIMLYKKKNC